MFISGRTLNQVNKSSPRLSTIYTFLILVLDWRGLVGEHAASDLQRDVAVPLTGEVKARTTRNDKGLVIDVVGFFNIAVHNDFRHAFEGQAQRFNRYAVNLQKCDGIDSAGLGMLLLLRDFAKLKKEDLLITHCPPQVQTILRYSNFDQLFTIVN